MNLSLRSLVCMLLITFSHFVWSEETCNYEGTQAEMNACSFHDFNVVDQELNRVYKKLMDTLTPADRNKLRVEQRAWLKQRDPKCEKDANDQAEGGSIWPLIYNGCLAELTKSRIDQLNHWKK